MSIFNFLNRSSIKTTVTHDLFDDHFERLVEFIKPKKSGFYLEAGANDGIFYSYTYPLEKKFEWKGILIEPSKDALNECKKNRSKDNKFVNCALVSNSFIGDKIAGDFDGNYMSSAQGVRLHRENIAHPVKARTLESILIEYNNPQIDLLSLDVEGYEMEVLDGINFGTNKPIYILIEIYNKDYDNILQFLTGKNYLLIANITNYSKDTNPLWDGTHNDYLFKIN